MPAFITGMYQTSIGAQHHRSGRGTQKIYLPEGVELVPKLFQNAGYYSSISGWPVNGKLGKTDYNFEWDESVDHMRSVRTKDFKYIRNFLPRRPYLQPCAYKDAKAILIALREYHRAGKLNDVQQLLFREVRPAEELYAVHNDP